MRIGSLCSGIGGLDLGLEMAGLGKVVFQVEKDEFCRKILARRWPSVAQYEDLRTVGGELRAHRFVSGIVEYAESDEVYVATGDEIDGPNDAGWVIVEHELQKVDILCGGIPCQPASVAGARKGTSDDRWLWPEALRIVDELRPKFCVFENVAGLRTLEKGEALRSILRSLAASGYDVEWSFLRASDLGAPHRRERIFILAWRRELGNPQGIGK